MAKKDKSAASRISDTASGPVATRADRAPSAAVPASPMGQDRLAPSNPAVADQVGYVAAEAARVVHQILPHRVPAYLAGAALLAVGVIDLPVAFAGGLAYEALRRWTPQRRSDTG